MESNEVEHVGRCWRVMMIMRSGVVHARPHKLIGGEYSIFTLARSKTIRPRAFAGRRAGLTCVDFIYIQVALVRSS